MIHAGMRAEILAIRPDEPALLGGQAPGTDEPGIIPVRDKADLHGIRRIRAGQADIPRDFPHIVLLKLSQRQHQTAQNVLRQTVQHVGLIPCGALRHAQAAKAVLAQLYTGIVAAGNVRAAQLVRFFRQQAEFHAGIAQNAGVGRAPFAVAVTEGSDHLLFKQFRGVNDMQFNAQRIGSLPGGLHCGVMGRGKADDRPLHRKALLLQNAHGHAGIHAAAHAHQNLVLRFKGVKTHSVHHVPPYA